MGGSSYTTVRADPTMVNVRADPIVVNLTLGMSTSGRAQLLAFGLFQA